MGCAVFLAVVLCAGVTGARDCERVAEVTEIAQGVFVRPGRDVGVFEGDRVANVGFIVGGRCVAVIDTGGSEAEGRALRCAIRGHTPLPVCYVINTHVHPDHILGNRAFAGEGVRFVGHAHLPRAMSLVGEVYLRRLAAYTGETLGPQTMVAPDRTVAGEAVLDLGGRRLRLTAHGRAHTDTDLSVYDEATGTLWLSDLLFVGHVPVLDGSVLGWLETLEGLKPARARRAVPGHGPVSVPWPNAARDTERYLRVLRDGLRAWIAEDGDLREAQGQVGYSEQGRWRLFAAYHQRNIAAAFRELEWEE
jgi:quinoprotein relay system zinc metallohydrolase 2